MTARQLGVGAATAAAVVVMGASVGWACTVTAADPSHEFRITPNSGSTAADEPITAEGYCDAATTSCTNDQGTTVFTPALRYAPCASTGCPPQVLNHEHDPADVPCASGGTDLDSSAQVQNTGSRQRVNNTQVVTGTGVMPTDADNLTSGGKYVVCHDYKSNIMWDVFTVV
ncbi:MAG: hypothetical protein ACRD03_03985 [Acidimicrobiales bacterium]